MNNNINSAVNNWIKASDYDIKSAGTMMRGGRYLYVVFLCHLSTEKMLKALVTKKTRALPPKTHDLYHLIKLADITAPDLHSAIVSHLNQASIPTRYPEDIAKITKEYGRTTARRYLKETRAFITWLKKVIT